MEWKVLMRAVAHHTTYFLGKQFPETIPLVFVTGYPKSGTTWACQLAADYLQLPFPRYTLLPIGCAAVVHGHQLVSTRHPRGIYVVRDGRDALVSRYFHLLRYVPDGDNPRLPRAMRRFFPNMKNKADIRKYLPHFLREDFERPGLGTHYNWADHVRSFFEAKHPKFAFFRYEDLLTRDPRILAEALSLLDNAPPDLRRAEMAFEKYSFGEQLKRHNPEDPKFLRKGESGDWRNHFTREAAEIFDHYAGDMLVRAGYEPDRSWVQRVGEDAPAEADEPQTARA